MVAHVIEPITSQTFGAEIDSTSEMLTRIDKLNQKIKYGSAEIISGSVSSEICSQESKPLDGLGSKEIELVDKCHKLESPRRKDGDRILGFMVKKG